MVLLVGALSDGGGATSNEHQLQQLHGGLQQSFPLAKGFALDEARLDA